MSEDMESVYKHLSSVELELHQTKLERDDIHREMMDLRYQLELAKAA